MRTSAASSSHPHSSPGAAAPVPRRSRLRRSAPYIGAAVAFLLGLGVGTPRADGNVPDTVPSPVPAPTVTVTARPSATPTVTVTATPEPAPTVTVTETAQPVADAGTSDSGSSEVSQTEDAPAVEAPEVSVYYQNCAAARAAGAAPIYSGEPGYRSALDRDGDGVACE